MSWLKDKNCELALMGLEDAIRKSVLANGGSYTLVLISEDPNEEVYMSLNGKSVPRDSIEPGGFLARVMEERARRWKESIKDLPS